MPPRQQPHTPRAGADSYRSSSCHIGTHHACAESSPATAPVDVPVIYESCDCPCHTIVNREVPTEAAR
ncbi:hypothetical protein [Streptomyces cathayae]|uniref:Uncharacterized protein n=1 Tax=Streptomyces cathayae TaxID=3031124 RepID=A0ABY8K1S0_9ACTN|nr:hypothetical protein [Streptomyces sp. HUAS 5]WGD42001.1 hypothetical protein PYS65_18560 [Streptomyces sp. HUAS 5]